MVDVVGIVADTPTQEIDLDTELGARRAGDLQCCRQAASGSQTRIRDLIAPREADEVTTRLHS